MTDDVLQKVAFFGLIGGFVLSLFGLSLIGIPASTVGFFALAAWLYRYEGMNQFYNWGKWFAWAVGLYYLAMTVTMLLGLFL